ncbi:hypothetical protein ABKV19_026758 [Rosa sericea]
MASTSSRRQWKYDVFLSFRGTDTRKGFTGRLYSALNQKGILIFMDDPELEKGKSIRPELLAAIEDSRCAIVILSKNYARSSWCLDELVKIIQCMKEMRQQVLPVFLDVDPSDVRHQRGRFGLKWEPQVEVREHEEVYAENEDRLNARRAALTEVANLSGWHLREHNPIEEAQIVEEIVKLILKKSVYTSSSVDKGFIGMDSRIHDLLSNYICPKLRGVRFIGIHGMRGIGKTTVARAIYDEICQDFDRTCFLSNVREMSKNNGLVSLQEKLLSKILMEKIENIEDEYDGAAVIERRLCRKKVLVVIDDVDQLKQLEKLAGSRNWFGSGSRIIITTTDVQLLKAHDVDATYKANGLNRGEALQLLSLKAFKKCPPPEDYLVLCDDILGYAQGLPLALVVLGSFLFGRSADEWASAIERLKNTPDKRIIEVLRISFDGLDEKDKEIFLHIACFYKGKDKDRVTQILDYCKLNPVIGLSVLTDRCLITISNNELSMHDLLQEMGWEIVSEQSPTEPGKRSRLWSHEDINTVLKRNKGTDSIQGMVMELTELQVAHWKPEAFSNLSQLILLHIRNVDLPEGLTCLSNSLRLLEWTGYPLRSLPKNFEADELIELNLCHSNIKQLWKGTKNFDKLKFIKLRHSQNIVETPDLAGVQNLETLDLEGCENLERIHQSLGFLKKLIVLNLKDCKSLKSLPSRIEMESLETFILSNCSKVKKIPEFVGNMERLSVLCLDETAIEELPVSIERLSGLVSLNLGNCRNLVCLPSTFNKLKSVEKLNLSGCLKLGKQQVNVEEMDCFKETDVNSGSAIEMSATHDIIEYLRGSIFHGCEVVWGSIYKFLPSGLVQKVNTEPMSFRLPISDLCNLTYLNLSNSNLGEGAFANEFGYFPSLVTLNLSGNNFVRLPSGIGLLSKLENFNLENCKRLQELSDLPSNSILDLRADGCTSLKYLFDSSNLNRLNKSFFNFINCFNLNGNQGCNNIAFEMLKTFMYQGISNNRETFEIVIPGSNIPEWFSHRRVGRSLSVSLPADWNNKRFLGFALCAVFVLRKHHRDKLSREEFKTFNATHHLVCCLKLDGRKLEVYGRQPAFRFSEEFCQVKSDHMWLFYVSHDKYFGTEWWHNSCSQVEFFFETRGLGLKVKECGVRLIYEQDVPELNRTTTQSSSRMSPYQDILIGFDIPVGEETSSTGSRTCTLEEL